MAKFAKAIIDEDLVPSTPAPVTPPPAAPVTPPAPPPVAPIPTPAPSAPTADFVVTQEEIPGPKKEEEHWAKAYWRPAMGWLYMLICLVDFVIFPAISMFVPMITKMPYVAWQSLSLSNGGLIHMAFGAILGVAAYGRTQEKVASKQ